jgi:ankyrin repeat protein
VEELALVLTVDFDDVEGIPKLNPNWRWEDEEQALLMSCSSLIVIINTEDSRVVHFSHFSVKEFLTSTRLTDSSKDVSYYHIDLEPAHTVLAQACMSVLLQPDDCVEENGSRRSSPLAEYAAEHWVTHAQFRSVSSFLRTMMEYLFDLDKPYFAAWLESHNIDIHPDLESSSLYWFGGPPASSGTPLYYASLCGFQDLVEHLVVKHPGHVNTSGGFYMTPLVAALAGRYFQTANMIFRNGALLDVRGRGGFTLLHSATLYAEIETVQVLLDYYKVDVNARDDGGWAPLHAAVGGAQFTRIHNAVQSLTDSVQILLEHGADVNARTNDNSTPLHKAAQGTKEGSVEVMHMLLEHGANVGAKDDRGGIPLHKAVQYGRDKLVPVLLSHGANVGAKDNIGQTPLHKAAKNGTNETNEIVRMLMDHHANVDGKDDEGRTPLHRAAENGRHKVVRVLLAHGANVGAEDDGGRTPLHKAAEYGMDEVVILLLKHGADAGAKDYEGRTPSQLASAEGQEETVTVISICAVYGMTSSTGSLCLPWELE